MLCCAVAILVDLLTLEVHSYGEESLAGSKVVEHVEAAAPSAVCSSASVPQPAAAVGPPVRPQPPQPTPPLVNSNRFIQPSEFLLHNSNNYGRPPASWPTAIIF